MDYNKLIGREIIKFNADIVSYLKNKRVLITGAGGSIGRNLSGWIFLGKAQRLYLFDHSENNLFETDRQILKYNDEFTHLSSTKTHVESIVGEIQDTDYVNFLIDRLNVDIVFHTAAHKHVGMSEQNPVETIKNNVFGTQNIINACRKFNVEKFILISTDKAVEPISIYGASKFLAEELVLREKDSQRFLTVRFGNVIGSSGSVVRIFEDSISQGVSIDITHKDIKRYFMTIDEAVSLILKIGDVGKGGNLYILDMGKPVSIEELAKKIMVFYNKKVEIKYTHLKKGEKFEEKLWSDTEEVEKTDNQKIFKCRKTIQIDVDEVLKDLKPICFFDPVFPEFYRDKRRLRIALNKVIPTIEVGNERRY